MPNSQTFLIDTPGFDDTSRSDTETLQSIASCLADLHQGLLFQGQRVDLSGIVYVHAINDVRMTGSMMKNLKMFRLLVGKEHLKHCTMVTSKWGLEDAATAENREQELMKNPDYWSQDLAAGAIMSRFVGTPRSALDAIEVVTRKGMFLPQLTQE